MNVVIDQGNSSAKIGIFEEHLLKEAVTIASTEELELFLKNFSGDKVIISSVNQDASMLRGWVSHFSYVLTLSHAVNLPVTNKYETVTTLGMDRIAAVCGAHSEFKGQNCLVIDAGTCITYDFINSAGEYHGGAISPGLGMRFRAMHKFTARLPLAERFDDPPLTGKSTLSCMQSGVVLGTIDEIEGRISRYRVEFPELNVILCGGDSAFFENKLKASIFASPELVLKGLNSILLYNANH